MAERVKVVVFDVPTEAEISYNDAVDEDNIRHYYNMRSQKLLPGDIDIECETAPHGGWFITIWENPNKGGG